MSVRPANTQISLNIRRVWSESSLWAQWVAKDPSFLHADNEDSDQIGRIFAGRTFILLVLSCRGSNVCFKCLTWANNYLAVWTIHFLLFRIETNEHKLLILRIFNSRSFAIFDDRLPLYAPTSFESISCHLNALTSFFLFCLLKIWFRSLLALHVHIYGFMGFRMCKPPTKC